jgi:general stress protein YciG
MNGKSKRGFASMDPARQRDIASKGGKAAHAKGTAHEWTADEARRAGRKGGEVVSRDRAHMEAIGRAGGEARGRARQLAAQQQASAAPTNGTPRFQDREMGVSVSREGIPSNTPRPSVVSNRPSALLSADLP